MANAMSNVLTGVIGVVGGVIGLVIIAEVIDEESDNITGIGDTVVSYIVPVLALGLLASALGVWKFG